MIGLSFGGELGRADRVVARFGGSVVSLAFECQLTIGIANSCCWRATADEDGHYCFAVAL
jgi:hypothetical protein